MRWLVSVAALLVAAHLAWAPPPVVVAASPVTIAQVQAAITAALASVNPLVAIAPGATGHVVAIKYSGTTSDMVPTLTGDASGNATATRVAVQRPAYTSVTITSGATTRLPAGFAYYDLTGSGLVAAATVLVPPNPQDRQVAQIVAMGALAVTALSVQDPNGWRSAGC